MSDVIILHGAWHQPAHYDGLAARLRAGGDTVHVPDIGGLPPAEATGTAQALVDAATEPPLVLAHSFGGVTAGHLDRVGAFVFLHAWVLDVGETPQRLIEKAVAETGAPPVLLPTTPEPDGRLSLEPRGARAGLYADCTEDDTRRAVALLRPESPAIFGAEARRAAWTGTPSAYVDGTADLSIMPALRSLFASRCTTVTSLPTSHSSYLSAPDEIVRICRAARTGSGR
ncbi:alpha/beta hydrolase [Catenuloplanes indicus]|uniref:AB hydrolase-1 domain-containing protein n=1 Tax=Catenuloplanes indicus TaxID=137267 RepID=A0AAE3VUP3_9ACTN|nr:alpha/beta hydrolase [Catenuloplanes indicus]MDQ0364343.1 hypothetical protein [Catenuloplanes indicus]